MVDDTAVHFFRHTVVVAAIPGLHVINGNPHPLGQDAAQAAVCVTENQKRVGSFLGQHLVKGRQDLANLLAECLPHGAEVIIRRTDTQVLEKNVTQVGVEVLARVHQFVVTKAIELPDDQTEANDLWTGPQHREDFHRNTSSAATGTSSTIRQCCCRRASRDGRSITLWDELYSSSSGCTGSSLSRSSGSIGRIT